MVLLGWVRAVEREMTAIEKRCHWLLTAPEGRGHGAPKGPAGSTRASQQAGEPLLWSSRKKG